MNERLCGFTDYISLPNRGVYQDLCEWRGLRYVKWQLLVYA